MLEIFDGIFSTFPRSIDVVTCFTSPHSGLMAEGALNGGGQRLTGDGRENRGSRGTAEFVIRHRSPFGRKGLMSANSAQIMDCSDDLVKVGLSQPILGN